MTEEDIDAMEARANAELPVRWADFIEQSRADNIALIAEVRRLREKMEHMRPPLPEGQP